MPWSDHHRRAARYNHWINSQLYQACHQLSQQQLSADAGLFFNSISGTLNHLLITDLLWLSRLANSYPILEELRDIEFPPQLDGIISHDLNQLWQLRQRIDDVMIRWTDLLRQDDAKAVIEYTSSSGTDYAKPLDATLQHVFNHQTHHRGQITAVLGKLGVDYGETDLLFMPGEN
ncbi:DinB family protein [Bacterioplanoides sp.]|uniref:DinB family protein n=1 Tax=Bacterioplanoides sp. TaxID=2066072 RepID=UPI003B00E715